MSIRLRLFLSHVVIIFLILVGIYFFLDFSLTDLLSKNIDAQLLSQAEMGRDFLSYVLPDVADYTYQQIDSYVDKLQTSQPGNRVSFIDLDGKVWGDSKQNGENLENMDDHGKRPEIIEAIAEGCGTSERFSDTLKRDLRYCALLIKRDSKPVGICRVAMDVESIQATLVKVKKNILLSAFFGLLKAVILATI